MDVGSDRAIYRDADMFRSSRWWKERKIQWAKKNVFIVMLGAFFVHAYHQFSVEQLDFLEQWNRLDFEREIISIQVTAVCWREKLSRSRSARHLNVLLCSA